MQQWLFPLFIDLSKIQVVILGAGAVSYRKAKRILEYNGNVTLISPEIRDKKFYTLQNTYPMLQIKQRMVNFAQDFLDCTLVVTATDDFNFNQIVVDFCNKHKFLVNNATSKSSMSASFACSVDTSMYSIAIQSHGNPKYSLSLRERIIDMLEIE